MGLGNDEAKISAHSVRGYYSVLEDTLLGLYLYPWSTSIRKELAKTPKFYFFDNDVVRAIQGELLHEPSNIERGHLFEQWVINEAYRLNAYLDKNLKLNFWKTTGGAEVDLILSRAREIVLAIECKATDNPGARDLSGLKSFKEEYPDVPCYLCTPVKIRREIQAGFIAIPPKSYMT